MRTTTTAALALSALALLGASACAGSTADADVATSRGPQASTSSSPSTSSGSPSGDSSGASTDPSSGASTTTAPARTPQVGDCYRLDYRAATQAVSEAAPVDCGQPHTAQTAYVGTIDPYEDGHLLAVDSDRVQERIAETCPARVDSYVGGDREQHRLSRVRAIWFSPSLRQSDAGATWFRCDVVAVRSQDALATLPTRMRDALGTARGADLALCGTAAPDKKAFRRVTCDQQHSWKAVSSVDLPQDAAYLGKAAGKAADSTCQSTAADRAADPLKYTWSFQWPTREDWDAGQRWGLCWIPS